MAGAALKNAVPEFFTENGLKALVASILTYWGISALVSCDNHKERLSDRFWFGLLALFGASIPAKPAPILPGRRSLEFSIYQRDVLSIINLHPQGPLRGRFKPRSAGHTVGKGTARLLLLGLSI